MELNKEQLQRVEHYLNVKDITYIDLRMEVFDHIVSDIEAIMIDENAVFETAFYSVRSKWNKYLEETSSFYFGIMYAAPKVLIEKAKKVFKKHFFMLFASYFIPLTIFSYMDYSFSESSQYYFNKGFKVASILFLIICFYVFIKKNKPKIKTTYSFILKTQSLGILIGFIIVLKTSFFENNKHFNGIAMGLFFCFTYTTFVYFKFYKKHKEAIKKYKIS
jgi:hypothetical protein